MRMLISDSLLGVAEGSSSAPAAPLLVALAPPSASSTATTTGGGGWAWTASQVQAQVTPEARGTSTGFLLAAMLCAIIGAIILHNLLRCALHYCGGRRRRRAAQHAGLMKMKSALRRMPVAVYEAEAPGGGAPAGAECAICLGEFEHGDAVRLLPRCRHGFHVGCIDTWLSAHSSCPICRDSLLDEGATTAGGEAVAAAWMSALLFLP